jgi:hypothetical protein
VVELRHSSSKLRAAITDHFIGVFGPSPRPFEASWVVGESDRAKIVPNRANARVAPGHRTPMQRCD